MTIEAGSSQEKSNKKVLAKVAAVALAGASLLGISGKPQTGVGVGVETLDPNTGQPVTVGVMLSSTEGEIPLGLPRIPEKDYKDIDLYTVRIGGEMITVYKATLEGRAGGTIKTVLGVYPGFESYFGK